MMTDRNVAAELAEMTHQRRMFALKRTKQQEEADSWKAKLEAIHIKDDDWQYVQRKLNRFTAHAGVSNAEGRCLVINGKSGAGKSHIIKRYMNRPDLQPGEDEHGPLRPLIYIEMPPACTNKFLASKVHQAETGDLLNSKISVPESWDQALAQVYGQCTSFMIIDEVHHAMSTIAQRTEMMNTIKSLLFPEREKASLRRPRYPLQIILAGIPAIAKVIQTDTQLSERAEFYSIKPLPETMSGRGKMAKFLSLVEGQLGFSKPSNLSTEDMVLRMMRATEGYTGRAMRLIKSAAFRTIDEGGVSLSREALGEAVSDMHDLGPAANPFLVADPFKVAVIRAKDRGELTFLRGNKKAEKEVEVRDED
jgi:hypothetical protein